jgi:hypothetical protein
MGVSWVLILVGVTAAKPWPSLGDKATVAEERIQQALADDTRLEFIETPLTDVVTFLKELHDIPIEIERKALDAVGVGSDVWVTRNLKGISLASALRLMLNDLDLTYVIEDEVLLITTRERAEASAQVRVYNVAPLLQDGLTAEELADALRDVLGTSSDRPDGALSTSCIPVVGTTADGRPTSRPAVPATDDPFGAPAAPDPAGEDPFKGDTPGAGAAPPAPPPASPAGASRAAAAMPGAPPVVAPPVWLGCGGPPPAREPARRIVPLRQLLLVRDTSSGHREIAELIGAVAEGLREAPQPAK